MTQEEWEMDLGLRGAKAVVSGGSQGIGLAVAKALVTEGAIVEIAARSEQTLAAAVAELRELGSASGQVCDISDFDATVAWMNSAAESMGGA